MPSAAPLLSFVRTLFGLNVRPAAAGGGGRYASDAGEYVDEGDVLALSAAYACVRILSGTVGSLPFEIKQKGADGFKSTVASHPLARILQRAPNAEQTASDFWEGGTASLEVHGNLTARKLRGSQGQIVGLDPLPWGYVNARRNAAGAIVYDYKGEILAAADVLHIRGFGGNPLGGLSPVGLAAQTFGAAKAVNRAAASVFKNGARPSGAVQTDLKLDAPQREQLENKLETRFQGAINAGRPLILDHGLKWETISFNAEESQLLQSRAFSVEEVCRIFGVPPFMIGHTEKSTSWGTGIEQQTLGFQKFTMRPRLRKIEQALEQQLLDAADIAAGISIELNVEGLLRGDSVGRGNYYRTMTSIGAMTINEVRRIEGLPPVEGGDVVRLQMQNVPIAEAAEAGASAALAAAAAAAA